MASHLGRRKFLATLGGAAAWPLAAQAQKARTPVLGFLGSAAEADYKTTTAALRRGLNEAGYVEKQNLLIDYRWADFQYERLPALAAELVKRPVDAIFATGSVVSALAAKSATATIPIVFANGSDPVQYGLVASLSRPGGNVTGITFINSQLGPKRIQLLQLLNPRTAVVAVLVNPKNPNAADAKNFIAAGRGIGVEVVIVNASTEFGAAAEFNRWQMRPRFADSIRASSPSGLREQAGHMTASDFCVARYIFSCQAGAIHT
jgi:ABC-type uncharacterized transport system substrate-binding protein